ncbi:PadR family transcriptional regulator [Companilactobacillus halodurans]|uniref:PadR family transcriptional regulator n=1 Tax=Companilactobacillus halodurans TaxID=2584183 RepID=A0A5P0ZQ20_9LACO|nr:PadR family transcriptional regulator [Companilactobacillus halodurans]MQS76292.1 PadR family transcriptional regulator [Companilactobacillus halodurans]MQS96577.1 PadR family transcriptional regulator [Companilactobacillus halodurans]
MPKKRILPYVLLGLINNKGKLSGYQISQEFKNEVGEFWHASHSQIYPELARMKDDGWVKDEDDGKSTYYLITDNGQQVLRSWLEEPLSKTGELFSLKLYFIKDKSDSLLKSLIRQELEIKLDKLTHLKKRLKTVFFSDKQIEQNYGHYLILTRAIERETNHVKWLRTNI